MSAPLDGPPLYPFDLSGYAFLERSDISRLNNQAATFNRIQEYNSTIRTAISLGNFDATYYQFSNATERQDFYEGQQLLIQRYPNSNCSVFADYRYLSPPPYAGLSTIYTGPGQETNVSRCAYQSTPTLMMSQTIENTRDLNTYIYVSSYNQSHPKRPYKFGTNDEKLAYIRACVFLNATPFN